MAQQQNINSEKYTPTDDIDVWIKDSIENRQKLRKTFHDYYGIDFFMIETMKIVSGWTNFNLNNGMQLDLMLDMKGLEGFGFEECYSVANKAILKV